MSLKYINNILKSNFKLPTWYTFPYPKELRKQIFWLDQIDDAAQNCDSFVGKLKRPFFSLLFFGWLFVMMGLLKYHSSTWYCFLFFVASLSFSVALHIDSWENETSKRICDYSAHMESPSAYKTLKLRLEQGCAFKTAVLEWVSVERDYIRMWRKERDVIMDFNNPDNINARDIINAQYVLNKPIILEVNKNRILLLDTKVVKDLPSKIGQVNIDFRLRYDVDLKKNS